MFTPSGDFVTKLDLYGTGVAQVASPRGIATGPSDKLYIADSWSLASSVEMFRLSNVLGDLTLRDATDPAKRTISIQAKDLRVNMGSGNSSSDDPTLHGATVRVVSSQFDNTYNMPANAWTRIGIAGTNKGYKYKDSQRLLGPFKTALMKPGVPGKDGLLQLAGKGSALGHTLTSDPTPVSIVVTMGDRRVFCSDYSGVTKKFVTGKIFKSRPAAALSPCHP